MAYMPNPRITEEVAEMEFRQRERRLQRDLNTSHEEFTPPRSGLYRVLPSIVVLLTFAAIVAVVVIHFW